MLRNFLRGLLKIKVLYVHESFPRIDGRGGEIRTNRIMGAMKRDRGVETICVYCGKEEKEQVADYQYNVDSSRYFFNVKAIKTIVDVIKKHRPNLIHANTLNSVFPSLVASKITKTPILINYITDLFFSYDHIFSKSKALVAKIFEKFIFSFKNDGILVACVQQMKSLSKIISRRRGGFVVAIPEFTSDKIGNSNFLRKKYDVDRNVVVCITSFVKNKRPDVSLKVFAKLLDNFYRRPSAEKSPKLFMLGDGKMKDELYELCQDLGLMRDVDVFFEGYVTNVEDYLASADVLLHTGMSEAFPIVFLDALKHGCFIVTTPVGGYHETIKPYETGHVGWSVNQLAFQLKQSLVLSSVEKSIKFRGKNYLDSRRERFQEFKMKDAILDIYVLYLAISAVKENGVEPKDLLKGIWGKLKEKSWCK